MPINQKKVQSNSGLSKRLHNLLCLIDVHILFCEFSFFFFFFYSKRKDTAIETVVLQKTQLVTVFYQK